MLYLLVFVVCLCLSLVATRHVRNFANAKGWTEAPTTDRHVHSIPIPRLGGVAIYFSFMTAMLLAMVLPRLLGTSQILPLKPTVGLLGAATMVFLLGLVDDLRSLSPYWKFAVQALAGVWLYVNGLSVERIVLISGDSTFRWMFSLPLTVFWVLLITNAFNLIDGLDGLAAGSALFSTFVLLLLSLVTPNPFVAFLTVALAGATLGFLRFNFHPATIFLGDSGSLFIGFVLAALALTSSQKAPTIVGIAIPLVALGFPILDVALAVARRFLTAKPLFGADKQHIHHKLLKLGLSQRETVLILYVVTAAFGFLSLIVQQDRRTIALVLAVIGIGVLIGVQQLRYQEFSEMASALQRFGRRRQLLANHVAVRQATERLSRCDGMGAICAILRDTLGPIGFDGIQLESERNQSLPKAMIDPFRMDSFGRLQFSWSGDEIARPTWEIRLEITSDAKEPLGHLSLIRSCRDVPVSIDVNVLTNGFQTSLAGAVERVYRRMEAVSGPSKNGAANRSLTVVAGSQGD